MDMLLSRGIFEGYLNGGGRRGDDIICKDGPLILLILSLVVRI